MSVSDVRNTAQQIRSDGVITEAEVGQLFRSAGGQISRREQETIVEGLDSSGVSFAGNAENEGDRLVSDLADHRAYRARMNDKVDSRASQLQTDETQRMRPRVVTTTYGGTIIPEEVKALVRTARENGAEAYDVSQLRNPKFEDGEIGIEGEYTPYPQETSPRGSMAFDYTEITPQKLREDMETVTTHNRLVGYETREYIDWRTGETIEYQVGRYEEVTEKGTGSISSHYDDAQHDDPYARGSSGQKWSSNFAILADGSLHALPAMRRTEGVNRILTNPSLARGKRMLVNGHITIRNGVVTSIGISGRIHNAAADGDMKVVDPLAVLRAWGFEIAPNVRVQFEGGSSRPPVDDGTHVIG